MIYIFHLCKYATHAIWCLLKKLWKEHAYIYRVCYFYLNLSFLVKKLFFSLRTLIIQSHCLLASIVSYEMSAVDLIRIPPQAMRHFSLSASNIFSFWLAFSICTAVCMGVDLPEFIYLDSFIFLDSLNLRKCSSLFLWIFSCSFSPLSSGLPADLCWCTCWYPTFLWSRLHPSLSLFSLLSRLHVTHWYLRSSWLIPSSDNSNLLFIHFTGYFSSVIVLLIPEFPLDVFVIFIALMILLFDETWPSHLPLLVLAWFPLIFLSIIYYSCFESLSSKCQGHRDKPHFQIPSCIDAYFLLSDNDQRSSIYGP